MESRIQEILDIFESTEVLIITAGAGMSADSGIPTYRGENGIWGRLEGELQTPIRELMTPQFIDENPLYMWKRFAKGRLELKNIEPHRGFSILKKWIKKFSWEYFVLTSNVDSMFQKAGFDAGRVYEVHGTGEFLQCTVPCRKTFWQNTIDFDPYKSDLKKEELPRCPFCGSLARPNVYIFNDKTFVKVLSQAQKARYQYFLNKYLGKKILVIEIGAGQTVKTIRRHTQKLILNWNAKAIRINPFEAEIEPPSISINLTALEALKNIDLSIKTLGENA